MMRFSLIGLLLLAAGCTSDERSICERLAECDELPKSLSVAECEKQAVRQVSGTRLDQCAECVEEAGCDTLVDTCRSLCEPSD